MSFKTLKVEQLRFVADAFNVEVDPKSTKPVLLAAIEEDEYVNWDEAVAALKNDGLYDDETDAAVEKVKADEVAKKDAIPKDTLLKMIRNAYHYEFYGYTFTKDHPFALTTAEDAEHMVETDDGFRYATPKEATEYYS